MGLLISRCFSHKIKHYEKEGVLYDDIKDQMRPFDMIFFRGSDLISGAISSVEKLAFGSGDWTHTGMIITHDIIPFENGVDGKLYVWESTMSGTLGDGTNDVVHDEGRFGVQIRDLDKVIESYDNSKISHIGWAKLINNPLDSDDPEHIEKIKQKLRDFYTENGDAGYDYNIMSMFKTITAKFPVLFDKDKKFFCSELITCIYQILELLPPDIDQESIAPMEFITMTNPIVKVPPIIIKSKNNI